jgi:hypothetical protein
MVTWVIPYGQLAWLRAVDDKLARRFFDRPDSFVVANNPFPDYACTVLRLFTDQAPFASWLAAGGAAEGGWVCYDPEAWSKTSSIEKRHLELALRDFALYAHAFGLNVVAAPSRDIIYAPGSDRPWQFPELLNDGYLRCQVPGSARDADVLVCQAQGAEKDLDAYAALLAGAANQQPNGQTLWSGLTTNFATAAQMFTAYGEVPMAGYWVTIAAQAQATVAAEFFRTILAQTPMEGS